MPAAPLSPPADRVAEVQGLFGPVSLSERTFQKLWRGGNFRAENLRTLSGKTLEIVSRGKWNRLDGPDFLGAEFRIGGERVVDVEEYASAEALAAIEGRAEGDATLEFLLRKDLREREELLVAAARERWAQKTAFMRRRLEKTPPDVLPHELVLETLGLRRNRPQMSRLALKFSPSAMLLAGAEALFRAAAGTWKLAGVRPANHPRARLGQYLTLLEKNPAWTRQLRDAAKRLPAGKDFFLSGKAFRSTEKLPALRRFFAEEIFAGTIGGTRFDTLMCDAVVPMLAAESGENFFPTWYHWFLGDAPAKTAALLREAELVSRDRPLCNGAFQGLLQIFLARGNGAGT